MPLASSGEGREREAVVGKSLAAGIARSEKLRRSTVPEFAWGADRLVVAASCRPYGHDI